jgi:hypothetical protein
MPEPTPSLPPDPERKDGLLKYFSEEFLKNEGTPSILPAARGKIRNSLHFLQPESSDKGERKRKIRLREIWWFSKPCESHGWDPIWTTGVRRSSRIVREWY